MRNAAEYAVNSIKELRKRWRHMVCGLFGHVPRPARLYPANTWSAALRQEAGCSGS
jgi:hypothetical protein